MAMTVATGTSIARRLRSCILGGKHEEAVVENTVKVFDYDIDIHGAWFVVGREPLCPGCLSDEEIDAQVKLLKDDLDAVAKRMKSAVLKQRSAPLFDV